MDNSMDNCKETLSELQPKWPQFCDLKAFETPMLKKYKVDFIPYNFLIDPDGKIIDQNLTGNKLRDTLARIFE